MNRRALLALSVAPLALAGCATLASFTTAPGAATATLASDVALVVSGAEALASAVAGIAGVPPATLADVQTYLAKIHDGAAAIAAGTGNATTTTQTIVAALKALAPIALAFVPGGSALVPVANAVLSMVPVLLNYVGVTGATGAVPVYTPESARTVLHAAPLLGVMAPAAARNILAPI
jgi:hypothetical protein